MNRIILTIPWKADGIDLLTFTLALDDDIDPTHFARDIVNHLTRGNYTIDIETTHTTRIT